MSIDLGRSWISEADNITAFTGAGISTESGIPDFRGPQGLWKTYKPVYFQEFVASHDARKRYWEYKKATLGGCINGKPNSAHKALVQLEDQGKLGCVITQNIDGLHRKAGHSAEVMVELHGTNALVKCLDCSRTWPSEEILEWLHQGVDVPQCPECQGFLKPATVSFGQSLDPLLMDRAQRASEEVDLFIVVGSSLTVSPANHYPQLALDGGAKLIIVNLEPTPLDDRADLVFHQSAGEILPQLVASSPE